MEPETKTTTSEKQRQENGTANGNGNTSISGGSKDGTQREKRRDLCIQTKEGDAGRKPNGEGKNG